MTRHCIWCLPESRAQRSNARVVILGKAPMLSRRDPPNDDSLPLIASCDVAFARTGSRGVNVTRL